MENRAVSEQESIVRVTYKIDYPFSQPIDFANFLRSRFGLSLKDAKGKLDELTSTGQTTIDVDVDPHFTGLKVEIAD